MSTFVQKINFQSRNKLADICLLSPITINNMIKYKNNFSFNNSYPAYIYFELNVNIYQNWDDSYEPVTWSHKGKWYYNDAELINHICNTFLDIKEMYKQAADINITLVHLITKKQK